MNVQPSIGLNMRIVKIVVVTMFIFGIYRFLKKYYAQDFLQEKIHTAFIKNESFDLQSQTDFSWDTIYIFDPYLEHKDIHKILSKHRIHFSWYHALNNISTSDNEILMVFVEKQQFVKSYKLQHSYIEGVITHELNKVARDYTILPKKKSNCVVWQRRANAKGNVRFYRNDRYSLSENFRGVPELWLISVQDTVFFSSW